MKLIKKLLGHKYENRYTWGELYIGNPHAELSLRHVSDNIFDNDLIIFSIPFLFKLYLNTGPQKEKSWDYKSTEYGLYIYHWDEDINRHSNAFYNILANTVDNLINMSESDYEIKIMNQKNYADIYYNWDLRIHQWNNLLQGLLNQYPTEDSRGHKQMFVYRT